MPSPRQMLMTLTAKYAALVKEVMALQRAQRDFAHDWDHALLVAQYVILIADGRLRELAWIAALCHNTDHLLSSIRVGEQMSLYLDLCPGLHTNERDQITEAVLNHHNRNDEPTPDNPVTILLKDADKLGNIGAQLLIRSGQYYSKLPAYDVRYIDKRDPAATRQDPGTVLEDIKKALEWRQPGWFRTPKALKFARQRFATIDLCLSDIVEQITETGLLNLPEDLILPPDLPADHQRHI